jgi:hypothetical protein
MLRWVDRWCIAPWRETTVRCGPPEGGEATRATLDTAIGRRTEAPQRRTDGASGMTGTDASDARDASAAGGRPAPGTGR